MNTARTPARLRSHGAALLTAMLTVTLVASFAAASLWQQYRGVEIETAERDRVQAAWVLTGALDWARLILREDMRTGGADSLSEPWAVPLQESRLSSFLAADRDNSADLVLDTFLSGQITDLQSRMNFTNLLDGGKIDEYSIQAFSRLYEALGLPEAELRLVASNMRRVQVGDNSPDLPLMPQRFSQLRWLGMTDATLARLRPYATLLPARTPVNLNTAPVEVVYACVLGLSMAEARQLVEQRNKTPFRSMAELGQLIKGADNLFIESQHSVASRMFEVRGRLRMDKTVVEEISVVRRDSVDIRTLYRERVALQDGTAQPPSPIK